MYVSNTSGEKSKVKINKEENDYNIIFNKQKTPNGLLNLENYAWIYVLLDD